MRLIDADALIERMKKDPLFPFVDRYGISGVINAEPTVHAVKVVRCEDCRYFQGDGFECARGIYCFENDYCSMGVRRENNADAKGKG